MKHLLVVNIKNTITKHQALKSIIIGITTLDWSCLLQELPPLILLQFLSPPINHFESLQNYFDAIHSLGL
jgi:hypothetical protein